jgi:hypothetical protein
MTFLAPDHSRVVAGVRDVRYARSRVLTNA